MRSSIRPCTFAKPPFFITAWLILCTFCNCAGWLLSAVHQLNAAGYAVAVAVGAAVMILFRKQLSPTWKRKFRFRKMRRRFCNPFALGFAALAFLAFLG